MENAQELKERLIALIKERSFLKSDEPIFKLSSGKTSNVYFDLRRTTLSPEGQYLIGTLYCLKLKELGLTPKAIGGLTMGADPVSSSAAFASHQMDMPVEAFVIRKEPKEHGLGRQAEGYIEEGDEVVIVDDVLTTGKSTIKAIQIAQKEGLKVIMAIVLLDRCEQNGKANVEALGLECYSILTVEDFKDIF